MNWAVVGTGLVPPVPVVICTLPGPICEVAVVVQFTLPLLVHTTEVQAAPATVMAVMSA